MDDTPKFTRTIEDFTCGYCGREVEGNGYTNHCPECLWSKHVDVNPGDRAAACHGLMEPISIEQEKGEFILTHQCVQCGYQKRNKTDTQDNVDAML